MGEEIWEEFPLSWREGYCNGVAQGAFEWKDIQTRFSLLVIKYEV